MRTNSSGQNSLHIAVQENAYHALAFLKEKFPKEVWIQHPDQDGLTPFDYFFSITSADEGEDIGE